MESISFALKNYSESLLFIKYYLEMWSCNFKVKLPPPPSVVLTQHEILRLSYLIGKQIQVYVYYVYAET